MTRVLFLIVIVFVLAGCRDGQPAKFETVTIGGKPFKLELALTEAEIRHGMMGRTSVPDNEGMLFVFAEAEPRGFWMKNCLVDLDVIYLDSAARVVSMYTMKVPKPEEADSPPSYPSRWPTQFVIELRAGRTKELGLNVGDKVALPTEKLLKRVR